MIIIMIRVKDMAFSTENLRIVRLAPGELYTSPFSDRKIVKYWSIILCYDDNQSISLFTSKERARAEEVFETVLKEINND